MNDTELKCYKWLMTTYHLDANILQYSPNSHIFTFANGSFISKSLQTDKITFSEEEIPNLQKLRVRVLVFSMDKEPKFNISIEDIDFERKRWKELKVYTTVRALARSIYLTASQYNEMTQVKTLLENDFGKPYSFGDILHLLCMSYATGRNMIMRESQPVMITQDEMTEQHLS